VLLATALSAPAAAATGVSPTPDPAPNQQSAPQYCVMVVGKAPSANANSPTLWEHCSTKSSEDARASLNSPEAQARLGANVHAASKDLLMTWFKDSGFKGNKTEIYGSGGPCDSGGYRVEPNGYWKKNLSGVKGTDSCNYATIYHLAKNYSRDFKLPVSYIGQSLNDHVRVVEVKNR
jgi:hypothetical protein